MPISLADTINNFKKDKNPEREIMIWEAMTATFIEFNMDNQLTTKQKSELFLALIALTNNSLNEEQMSEFKLLNVNDLINLTNIYKKYKPNFLTGVTAVIKDNRTEEKK